MKYYIRLLLFKCILFGFDLYTYIHTQLDLCYSSAHEISSVEYVHFSCGCFKIQDQYFASYFNNLEKKLFVSQLQQKYQL